jgi:hypothetical protein
MSLGFNSDVAVGDDVFHVQTENYGQPQYAIVTLVYHRGRILHRRNSSYYDLAVIAGYSEEDVGNRVEDQHRSVVEEVRSGAISAPASPSGAPKSASQGIQVRLRNANSWLVAGQATLDVQVTHRADSSAVSGANIEAYLSGGTKNTHVKATTGADGVAQLRFAAPNIAADGAELVIRADAGASEALDEIRFTLRAKPKNNPPEAKP